MIDYTVTVSGIRLRKEPIDHLSICWGILRIAAAHVRWRFSDFGALEFYVL
jgi:hypothetical protein